MLRGSIWIALALGLASCGDAAVEPAELGELCGIDGPFRLMELAPDRQLQGQLLTFDDRYVFTTVRVQDEGDTVVYTDPTVWSVGTCGETPRRLADTIDYIYVDPRWPDLLLGCRFEAEETVVLDPAGELPPQLVFADVGCFPRASSSGYILFEGDDPEDPEAPATLSFLAFPDDPRTADAEPIVLLSPETHPEHLTYAFPRPRIVEDALFTLTTEGTLLRIDLPGGEITVEQTDVLQYEVSPDGRYLLYQNRALLGDPERGEGLVFLRDRTTGEGTLLAQTNLNYYPGPLRQYANGVITLTLPSNVLRVYSPPALDFVDLPPAVNLVAKTADGRWLMRRGVNDGPIYVGDLHDPDGTTALFGGGTIVKLLPDALLMLDVSPCCSTEDSKYAEGGLWRVPLDGSGAQRVADRAANGLRFIDDRRLITVVDKSRDDGLADLLLLDLEDGSERLVDRDVMTTIFSFAGSIEDGIVRYSVSDGERSGIWLARLPEAE